MPAILMHLDRTRRNNVRFHTPNFIFIKNCGLGAVGQARENRDSVYRIVPENLEQLLNKHGPCRCGKFFGKCGKCSARRFVRMICDL